MVLKVIRTRALLALTMVCCATLAAKAQTLKPSSFAFGTWVVQTTSTTESFVLNDTLTTPLTIGGISVSGNFAQTSTCPISPATLAPNTGCTISVTFTPTATGSLSGTLTVNDNASNSPQTAQLTGTGALAVSLTNASLSFGTQVISATSAAKTVTLKNNQTVPLTIAGISDTGNFAQTSTCPLSPSTLGSGATCAISVTFTPTALGSLSGTLTINDNAPNSPQTTLLSGTGVAPATLTPSSLAFGSQAVGTTTAMKNLTLQNNQTAPLTIAGISTTGNFAQTSTCPLSPSTLGAGTSCAISVTFTPTALGYQAGTLTVSDNASNSPQTAQLSGTGTVPVTLSSSSLAFGNQAVGTTSAATVVTLQKSQTVPLTITGISTTGNFAQTSNCPLSPSTLGAGTSCAISVNFTPAATGSVTGTLTVSDNASNSPQTAQLSGTGTTPVALSASSLAFGNQAMGTTSAVTVVTLQNNQTAPLTIAGISTTGNFAQTSTCPLSPSTLGPGTSCTVSVTFTPSALGTLAGILTVSDNAATSPQTAQLSGTGTTPVTLSSATLSFGSQVITITSAGKSVTLKNNQTVPLTITGISTTGNFGETSTCPFSPGTLGAGASCTISVTFTPAATGSLTGILTVSDNSSNSPQTTQLSGTGTAPVTLSPPSLAFGNQFVNATSTATVVTLQNNQTVPLTIAGISTTKNFAQTSTCPLSPNTLAAGANCAISVTFTPMVTGSLSGTLTVSDNAPNSTQTVQLTGTGTAPVSLSNATLSFPSQIVTTTSAGKSVTLKNNQTIPLAIASISTTGNFGQTSTCPSSPTTLAAGASCVISVTFTPTAVGALTGTLMIAESANTSPQTVSLAGTGTLSGLLSISVVPASPTLSPGAQQQFVANGMWTGGAAVNISQFVTWSSSAPSVAPVNSTGLVQAVAQGSATITASYGSVKQAATVTIAIPTVNAVTVMPNTPTVPEGAYQQFTAVLTYTDGSTKNATSEVSWSSSTPAVATVTGSGLVSALAAGSTSITATAESVSGSSTLGVSQLPCVAAPPGLVGWWTGDGNTVDISGANSGTLQNGATYGNGEVAQAFSFGGNGASVLVNTPVYSPTAGTLMFWFLPTAAGSLTGSFDGTNRTPGVSIDASGNLNWEFGNLSAQVLGQVSSNQWSHLALTYSTSNNEVAVSVYLNGNLAASAISSQNSAWYPQLAFGAYLGVAQKLSFTGSMDEVAIFNQALSTQQIQQIYNAFGAGICKPALQSIALTPVSPSIAAGLSQQFDAVGSYSDGTTHDLTTSATWSSSNLPVATLNGSGQATAVAIGNATITAALSEDTGSANLIVVPGLVSVQVNPPNPAIAVGTTQAFTAMGTFSDGSAQNLTASISWSSSAPSIATIAAGGQANGVAAGQATITATAGSVSSSTLLTVTPATLSAITVAPASPAIAAGTTLPFTATGLFSDGSTQVLTTSVSWGSSTPSTATINSAGLAAGLAPGSTTITATLGSVVSNSAVLTVSTAVLTGITVNPANPTAPVGSIQQFTASGTFSDGSTQDVTGIVQWASSNISVASTSNATGSAGLTTCIATGSSSISATSGSITASTTLTVSNATLVSITVNPPGPSIGSGTTQQFIATGTFTDGSTQNLTTSVTWSSSNSVVVVVNSNALATSLTTGTATITAALGGISGSALLTVTTASVVSITVSPSTTAIPSGLNQAFSAVGTFTDGSMQNVTNSAYWTSSVPGVATVSNTSGSSGLVSSTSSGNTVINAVLGGVSGSGNLTVTSGILAAIEISPQGTTIPIGGSEQFLATGLYTDGSTANLTTSVTWASSSAAVATIGNSSGSQGMATSAGSGTTVISATSGSLAGSASLAVQDLLVSITVSPGNASIVPATTQQFTATATYTSGLTNDVTGSVLWSSSSPAVATIAASGGLATSQANGQTVITASLGSIGGSVNLAVSPTPAPTNFRVDISDGTTGQLFVSWNTMNGASYYNLQRSTNPTSGYSKVTACSGLANFKTTETISVMQACRNNGLTVGTTYYYEVQACYSTGCSSFSAPAANVPITSNCTAAQMPSMAGVATLPAVALVSSTVDPNIQFLPNNYQYAYYASPGVPRRNLLFVDLPGSDETCPAASALNNTAEKLGFDVICVNYSNLSAQDNICVGNAACFGNVSQAKENATGVCSIPGQSQCGIDPHTGQPYYLSNPSDAVTQRISMMLQYLNTNGYNQNGTNWGNYLSGTTPLWQNILLGGHSQGGDMATSTAYEQVVARAINLSGPPQATLVNNVEVGATYFSSLMATSIRNVYGLVSVDDSLYQDGVFAAVWQVLGFTPANNDAEVKLNTSTPIGLNCSSGTPSHNFSTSAPVGPDGDGHDVPLYLWNEDIYKFMLID